MKKMNKPKKMPWGSFVFLGLNIFLFFLLDYLNINVLWCIPSFFLNMFFFWAEYDIYKREQYNYSGWKHEMGFYMGISDKNGKILPKYKQKRAQRYKKHPHLKHHKRRSSYDWNTSELYSDYTTNS